MKFGNYYITQNFFIFSTIEFCSFNNLKIVTQQSLSLTICKLFRRKTYLRMLLNLNEQLARSRVPDTPILVCVFQGFSKHQHTNLMDNNEGTPKPLLRPGASARVKTITSETSENSSGSVTDSFMKRISSQPIPSLTRARPGRLLSFRQDKDLSLSPTTGKFAIPPSLATNENPNKKKFQPTIPTKKKPQEVKEKKESLEEKTQADRGSTRGRGRGRGDGAPTRGRGRGRANYIQVT